MSHFSDLWNGNDRIRVMYHLGFNTGIHTAHIPIVPVPFFDNLYDQYDWVAGYGAAIAQLTKPKGWLA